LAGKSQTRWPGYYGRSPTFLTSLEPTTPGSCSWGRGGWARPSFSSNWSGGCSMAAFPPWGSSTLHWIPLCTPGGSLENLVRLFMEQHQHPAAGQYWILSDEVQYLKDWEVYLKSLVDTYPHIRFMARGSAAAALRMKIRKSGAGGFNEFVLPPLSFAEYLRFAGRDESLISEREDEAGAPPVTSPPTSTASTTNFSVTGTSAAFPKQSPARRCVPTRCVSCGRTSSTRSCSRTCPAYPRQPVQALLERSVCDLASREADYRVGWALFKQNTRQ
jgi:hypothetical protein